MATARTGEPSRSAIFSGSAMNWTTGAVIARRLARLSTITISAAQQNLVDFGQFGPAFRSQRRHRRCFQAQQIDLLGRKPARQLRRDTRHVGAIVVQLGVTIPVAPQQHPGAGANVTGGRPEIVPRDQAVGRNMGDVDHPCGADAAGQFQPVDGVAPGQEVERRVHVGAGMAVEVIGRGGIPFDRESMSCPRCPRRAYRGGRAR